MKYTISRTINLKIIISVLRSNNIWNMIVKYFEDCRM